MVKQKQAVKAPAKAVEVRKTQAQSVKRPTVAAPKPARGTVGKGPIPNADSLRGLSLKMPKKGKGNIGEQIEKRLQKKSPWYSSIIDPLGGADCKIPDETGVETGTIQVVTRDVFTIGTGGVGGLRIISPYINAVSDQAGVDTGINYQKVFAEDTTPINIAWGHIGDPVPGSGYAFPGSSDIRAITNNHRIVSAGLIVEPEPSLDSNKGEFTLYSIPMGSTSSPNYNDYMNFYKSSTVPVNANKPGLVRWYPFTSQDWSFKSFLRTNGERFSQDDDGDSEGREPCPYWELGVVASGCEPGVVCRVTMVVNYEFTPTFNTLNVLGVSPSPVDQQETDLVERWVQDMPVASTVSTAAASKSPSSVSPSHDDDQTGFGMFFNILSELAPLALALI